MLTQAQVRNTKPGPKPQKLFDGRGLFLLIQPSGARWWRLKYRFSGRERLISLGVFPDVPLAAAREKRDEARRLVAAGVDPSAQRRAEREAGTFEEIAREWFERNKSAWTEGHAVTVLARLEQHLFPRIGSKKLRDITAPEILAALRVVERDGHRETARRVRQICGQVFRYAIASGRPERDPSADLRGALAPVQTKHMGAMTRPDDVAGLLLAIDDYKGASVTVKCALRLSPLVFVRPGVLRKAEWSEINFMRGLWEVPAAKMKTGEPLIVPLSKQAIGILRELHPVTGSGRYLFPSPRSVARPMSENALLAALRRMGILKEEQTPHGFRATARTILDEVLGERVDLIEAQLGHLVKDPNGRAYNRTSFLPERMKMMQRWSDYLDALKAGKDGAAKRA
jgi:integrase